MNKTTVKRLEEIAETIKGLKNELDSFSEEENRKYNNIPGNLQKSQNGRKTFQNIYLLENAVGCLNETLDNIDNILIWMKDE